MKHGANRARKLPEEPADNLAELSAHTDFDTSVSSRAIPIDLRPVIQAYRKRGRFLLRVEKLPQQARFSAGQNNGDGSWSLQLDELEDLVYFAPKKIRGEHVISIRLVSKGDAEAQTIAVIEYPVILERESGTAQGPRPVEGSSSEQRQENEELKAALAAREAELDQLRASAERMGVLLQQKIDLAVEEAQTKWKREQTKRLEEERAQLEEQFERRLAEREVRAQALADIGIEQQAQSMRRLAQDFGATKELLASRDGELAASRAEVERLRKERDSDIAAAKAAATAQMAETLKTAQIEWQARADTDLAQMTQRCEKAEKALAEAKAEGRAETKDLRAAFEAERKQAEERIASAKAKAEAESAKKLKDAEAEWQARADAAQAELKQRCETAEKALAAADTAKGDRDGELRELRAALKSEQKQSEERVAEAKAAGEADAAKKLKEAEAKWQKHAEAERASLTARCETAEKALATADAARGDRDTELRALRTALEAEQKQSKEQVAAVKAAGEADAARKAKEADAALAELKVRCDKAEKALATAGNAQARSDEELSSLRAAMEAERKRSEEQISAAKTAAAANAAKSLKDTEALWQKRVDNERASMAARSDAAEKALAAANIAQGNRDGEANALRLALEAERKRSEIEIAGAKEAADLAAKALKEAQAQLQAQTGIAEGDRDAQLRELRTELEQQREKAEAEIEAAKVTAEDRAGLRMLAAQARWEKESAAALATLTARCEMSERALAAAGSSAEREAEMEALHTEMEKVRQKAEADVAAAQAAADQAVSEKLQAAQSVWEKETHAALADAQARCERAEAALAAARRAATPSAEYDAYVQSLEREIKTLRATLVDREAAIVQAQAMQDQIRLGTVRETPGTKWQPLMAHSGEAPHERPRADRPSSKLFRDVLIVMGVVAAGVFILPRLETMLPNSVRWQIETLGGTMIPDGTPASPAPSSDTATSQTSRVQHKITYAQNDVNVRAGPSTGAAIVGRLKRGDQASLLEERANWDRVDMSGADGKPLQGWVYNTYLGANSPVADSSPSTPADVKSGSETVPVSQAPAAPVAQPVVKPAPTHASVTVPQSPAPAPTSRAPTTPLAQPVATPASSPTPATIPQTTPETTDAAASAAPPAPEQVETGAGAPATAPSEDPSP